MIMKIIREVLGRILVAFNFLTQPKPVERSAEEQAVIDEAAGHFQLYQFYACPFCIRVRRHARWLNISLTTKDAQNDPDIKKELIEQGGSPKVPCLRIEENGTLKWMYESKDIIQYLTDRFSRPQT